MQVDRRVYGWPEHLRDTGAWETYATDAGFLGIKIKNPFKAIGKAVSSVGKAVGKAAGGVAKFVAKVDPVSNTLVRVAKGQRIDRAIGGAVADQRKIAKVAAPVLRVVSSGASFVPGMGTVAASVMRGAAAWGEGKNLAQAALEGAQGAIPGGELVQRGLSLAGKVAQGQRVDRALLSEGVSMANRYGGPLAGTAADSALRLARGERVVDVARGAVTRTVTPIVSRHIANFGGQQMNFLTSRLGSIAPRSIRRPLISAASAALPSPFGQRGTLLASALRGNPALGALSTTALAQRTRLGSGMIDMIRRTSGLSWRGLSPIATRLVSSRTMTPLRALSRDVGALAPDGRSYTVEQGDTGSKIAQKLTGDASRWPELKAANPAIAARKDPPAGYTQKFGMVLWGGEVLALPDSWIKSAPVATGAPASGETLAAVTQAQGILATWGKTDGANATTLADYGSQSDDINGTWDARDKLQLMSFAKWRGKNIGSDGHLTDEVLADLRAWTEEKARQVLPIPASVPTIFQAPPAAAPAPAAVSMPADFTIPQQQAPALPAPPALPPPPVLPPAASMPAPVLALPPAPEVLPALPPPPAAPVLVTTTTAPVPAGAPGSASKSDGLPLLLAGLGGAWAFGLF